MARITYTDLVFQFAERGLSGKHLTEKQGNFLYSLWQQDTHCPVQSRAKNGARFIEDTLDDGRRWKIYQEWNKSWLFAIDEA